MGILAASAVGTEHSWGTVRQALIRGQPRSQYLTAKLFGIALIAAVSLLLALGIGVWFSVIATAVADLPITLDVPGGPSAAELGLMVLRAGFGILPYGLLAFSLAVVRPLNHPGRWQASCSSCSGRPIGPGHLGGQRVAWPRTRGACR